MDDFEKAVFFSFDQTGAVSAQLKAQAAAYCEQAKRAPNICQACFEKFRLSQYAEVQFWCLKTLEEVLQQRYRTLESQERLFIRSSLMLAFCNFNLDDPSVTDPAIPMSSRPIFVRNKLAQLIVILIYIEYPAEWPAAFLDMLNSLSKGPVVVDMFIRVLNTLDEEVISFDFPRTEEESAAATRIKDSMRQQCISQVVAAWYSLIVMYKGQSPQLAAQVLEMMQKYVAWIDIGLVANDRFVPLLFEFLVSPNEHPQLRGAAAECLLAIVSKRMDAPSKLALLQQLQAGKACSTIMEEQEPEFALKLTALLTGIATEVLECSKKIEVNGASEQTLALTELVTTMLDEVLPPVFYFMQNGDEDMSTTTFLFLNTYVTRMKNSNPVNEKQATHLSQILAVVFTRMRYDPTYEDSLDEPDKSGLEEEERMAEYRREIMGLFRSINRVAPEVTRAFVESTLARVLQDSNAVFEDVEAAIVLLHLLGEGVTEESMKPGGGSLQDMVGAFLSTSIPCHSHRLIAMIYLETVTRYVKFVQYHADYTPRVLAAFLDSRGMHHPNPQVSSRASYLFMRFVKVLRIQLVPYLDTILQVLLNLVTPVVTYSFKGSASFTERFYPLVLSPSSSL
jgi:exportin-T